MRMRSRYWNIVTGILGIFLLLIGGVQIGIGIYSLLTLPGFTISSNIWTGTFTGIAGITYMYLGYADSNTRQNSNCYLVICALTTVLNILNILIIQVGEKWKFLSESDQNILEKDPIMKFYFETSIYASSASSGAVIFLNFVVGQFLFWGSVESGKTSSQETFVDNLHHDQERDASRRRFSSPSKLVAKENIQPLPSLDEVLGMPDPDSLSNNSSWVYNGEDKISEGLYPIGLETQPEVKEPTKHPPDRSSSFTMQRFARVHHRPQRAQSFAATRISFGGISEQKLSRPLPVSPVSVPQICNTSIELQKIRKWNSFTLASAEGSNTLSRKYHAFTLNRDVNFSMIEVGSLKSNHSDQDRPDFHTNDAMKEISQGSPNISAENPLRVFDRDTQAKQNSIMRGSTLLRVLRAKGPAPLPPSKNTENEARKVETKPEDFEEKRDKCCEETVSTQSEDVNPWDKNSLVVTRESSDKLFCSDSFEEDRDLEETESLQLSYESHLHRKIDNGSPPIYNASNVKNNQTIPNDVEAMELNDINREKLYKAKEPLTKNNLTLPSKSSEEHSNSCEVGKRSNFSNESLSNYFYSLPDKKRIRDLPEGTNPISGLNKPSKYESVHKEVVENVNCLLEQLPQSEFQKNKIVLRVPSFKTTGCQTESYRPLRRRASCIQERFLQNANNKVSKEIHEIPHGPRIEKEPLTHILSGRSSSSSGYSSPDVESKETSPIPSGPPSPCSSYGLISDTNDNQENKPNVTVIEVNKGDSLRFINSDAYAPSNDRKSISRHFEESIPTILENEISDDHFNEECEPSKLGPNLTEAVNPTLVPSPEYFSTTPRVVHVIRKSCPSAETTDGPKREAIATSSNAPTSSSHQFSMNILNENVLGKSDDDCEDPASTAAYIASLELLASHYKNKTLANAKQLQIQQKILEEQKRRNLRKPSSCFNLDKFLLKEESSACVSDRNCFDISDSV